PCSAGSTRCQSPSSKPCELFSGWRSAPRQTDFWWVSPCSVCSPRRRRNGPSSASSMTPRGSTRARPRALASVGRRLQAEALLLLLAAREAGDERAFPSLESLTVEGLIEEDARALLMAAVPIHLDEQVRDRIVAETRGNPLRLLEVLREMSRG